jgi:hypothetical protein
MRRAYVRSVFVALEGNTFNMKQTALTVGIRAGADRIVKDDNKKSCSRGVGLNELLGCAPHSRITHVPKCCVDGFLALALAEVGILS